MRDFSFSSCMLNFLTPSTALRSLPFIAKQDKTKQCLMLAVNILRSTNVSSRLNANLVAVQGWSWCCPSLRHHQISHPSCHPQTDHCQHCLEMILVSVKQGSKKPSQLFAFTIESWEKVSTARIMLHSPPNSSSFFPGTSSSSLISLKIRACYDFLDWTKII